MHKAAFWGHEQTVAFLAGECGLDKDLQDFQGDTPLHDAVRFGHAKVTRVLLDAGADCNIRNKDGYDALALALEYGKADVADMVRQHLTNAKL